MIKTVVLIFLLVTGLLSEEIKPYRYLSASEAVSDFIKVKDILVVGTEEGTVEVYDLTTDTLIDKVSLPKYKDILGDDMRSLILSVDYRKGRILFIARVIDGYRELYLYENKILTTLIGIKEKTTVQKVMFVDDNIALIQSMGNEIILFDIKAKKRILSKQLNYSSFSDLTLDEEHKYIYTADETPMITKMDVKTFKILKEYNKANKRDIVSIDFKNEILLSGGKDKRVIVYRSLEEYTMTKGQFFIYSVALNPQATLAAFMKNEENDISVVDINTMQEKYLLKGHNQTIIKIDFFNENELISADERNKLMFWKLE